MFNKKIIRNIGTCLLIMILTVACNKTTNGETNQAYQTTKKSKLQWC